MNTEVETNEIKENVEKTEITEPKTKKEMSAAKKWTLVSVGAVIALVLLVVVLLSARVSAYDKIYPNISIEGISVGGLSEEEALKRLESEYMAGFEGKSYTAVLYDRENKKTDKIADFSASDIEAVPDLKLAVKKAFEYGRNDGFFEKIYTYYSLKNNPDNLPMPGSVNSEKVIEIVNLLADGMETPVLETSYSISGNILTIANGHGGERVDREQAENIIKAAVMACLEEELVLKIEKTEPESINLDEFYEKIINSKTDAYYSRAESGEIVVVADFPGVEFGKNELKAALESGEDSYDITVKVTPAEVTAQELEKMLFRDEMGAWTSNFSVSNAPRSSNVRLTSTRINGVTLLPGEVFSYDSTIGRRTAANGYKTAGVYIGNKVEQGIGGGICQTSSTLYSAVLYANLEIVSRTSHSLPVSYMPPGQDATIAEGYIDFKFKNNTEYPIKIVSSINGGSVTCKIFGVKNPGETVEIVNTKTSVNNPKISREVDASMPRGYKKVTQKGVPGYNVASQRIVKVNGVETKRENLTKSVYRATDTIEVVNPADKDTSSEALSIYDPNTYRPSSSTTTTAPITLPQDGSEVPEQTDIEVQGNENTESAETSEVSGETPSDVTVTPVTDVEESQTAEVKNAE